VPNKPLGELNFSEAVLVVSDLVHRISGIELGAKQSAMVQSRLIRRVLELGLRSPEEYLRHLTLHRDQESTILVSLMTTHHSFFFREFEQFEYLSTTGLAQLIAASRLQGRKSLRVWSMACSRGQEAYSLSMFLHHHLKLAAPDFTYEIYGTDIDPESVSIARNGVYRWEEVKSIPSTYLANHWTRGTGDISAFVKAKKSIKDACRFETANLLALAERPVGAKFDLILCRNVFIYFNSAQVTGISNTVLRHLHESGLFFIGASESLSSLGVSMRSLGSSIYSPSSSQVQPAKIPPAAITTAPPAKAPAIRPLRVMIVDDSPTVVGMLKAILTADAGFEVVATAKSGLDAARQATYITFDVMTLDIHMPEQNGVDYLRQNFRTGHPPVVIISSVSREEATLGIEGLRAGASDYVEKPTMGNLLVGSDEIRSKVRCAARNHSAAKDDSRNALAMSEAFRQVSRINDPDLALRILVAGLPDVKSVQAILSQMTVPQPPTILVLDCPEQLLDEMSRQFKLAAGMSVSNLKVGDTALTSNTLYIISNKGPIAAIKANNAARRPSILAFANVGALVFPEIWPWPNAQLLVEDTATDVAIAITKWASSAHRLIPYTSFLFDSDEFINRHARAS